MTAVVAIVVAALTAGTPAFAAPAPWTPGLAGRALAQARPAPLIAAPLPATQPPPDTRIRATRWGVAIGALLGAALSIPLMLAFCKDAEEGREEFCGGQVTSIATLVGLAGAGAGAVAGAVVGAGLPLHRRAGYQANVWERASGELGQLALQLGTTTVLGKRRNTVASFAGRAALLTKLGHYLALGPELASYPLSRKSLETQEITQHDTVFVGGVFRVSAPVGQLTPYFTGALGYYNHLFGNVGGSAGLGAEWRVTPALSAGAEARLHGNLDALGEPFLNVTAGGSYHW
jgi:hypothetical protein